MADATTPTPKPKKRGIRWKRLFWTFVVLGAIAGGVYAASYINERRYFLIVTETEVKVAKGRMLPVGHAPFVPSDVDLRRAYQSFPLPGGIKLPRGETAFTDRVELDQALFRVLKDSIAYSLSEDNRRTPELVQIYLRQIRAIPGTSVSQQLELAALARDAEYVEARQHLADGIALLKQSSDLFRSSSKGQGGRTRDGEYRAQAIDAALDRLTRLEPERDETRDPIAKSDLRSATTGTSTKAAQTSTKTGVRTTVH
jgi:hypothetical protein